MSWLSDLFRKTLEDDAHDQPYGDWPSDEMLDRCFRAAHLQSAELIEIIPSGRSLPRSGSGVASTLRDTGASFAPVAPALLSNLFNHRSGN